MFLFIITKLLTVPLTILSDVQDFLGAWKLLCENLCHLWFQKSFPESENNLMMSFYLHYGPLSLPFSNIYLIKPLVQTVEFERTH